MIPLQIVDHRVVKLATTYGAGVVDHAILVRSRLPSEPYVLPLRRKDARQWIARNIAGRVAYLVVILWHTSLVFSI